MTKHTLYGSLVLTLLLGGCAIGPDYAKPEIAVPEAFRDANGSAAIDTRWWSRFNDPELSAAVEQALKTNDDLKTAEAKVDALLGKFDQAQSYLYPQLNGNGSLTRKGVYDATGPNLRDGVTSTYAASLSLASYEIDLFGKVRRANEAARAFLLMPCRRSSSVSIGPIEDAAASRVAAV